MFTLARRNAFWKFPMRSKSFRCHEPSRKEKSPWIKIKAIFLDTKQNLPGDFISAKSVFEMTYRHLILGFAFLSFFSWTSLSLSFANCWLNRPETYAQKLNIVKQSLSCEALFCLLWTLGVLLCHWLAAFWVDISLWEGVICLEIFRERKLTLLFGQNPSSLKELIGYVELTDFHEIWPEHSFITKEQKCVGEFFYFK